MISRTPRKLPCHEPFDGFCDACGSADAECKDTHLGHICSECRHECAYCEDWMMDDAGLRHAGKLMHIACALEAMDAEKPATLAEIGSAA
jgi:hypothetical protein